MIKNLLFKPMFALLAGLLLAGWVLQDAHAQEKPDEPKLVDRFPFDRVTLNAANDNAEIDVQLLDLPARRVPDPLPTSGNLEIRRLGDPTKLYRISWEDIARIELYEQLVLNEADQFVSAGKMERAYENLAFLHANYPELPGLSETTQKYLQQDAVAAFQEKQYEQSLAILASLYDLNPTRAGLARAVESIANRVIAAQIESQDFAAARRYLDNLQGMFPDLQLENQQQWEQRFRQDAQEQIRTARAAIAKQDFTLARRHARAALNIVPGLEDAQEVFEEIDRLSPQTIVGVGSLAAPHGADSSLLWEVQRVARLVCPHLVELQGIGSEGGDYRSRWAELDGDDTGLHLRITLRPEALAAGITPEELSLTILELARPESPTYEVGFAGMFGQVDILDGQMVDITWQRPFVKPIALMHFPVVNLLDVRGTPLVYDFSPEENSSDLCKLEQGGQEPVGPEVIIEQTFADEEEAFDALRRGEIEVLADIPPWQYEKLLQYPSIVVSAYRIPVVHVLQLNYANPLLQRREFRRGLTYGIDRARIVSDVLRGAEGRPGFRVLSGPIPAGVTVGDTLGYAYSQDIQPLPYEPRLAAVLHTAARAALAKLAAAEAKTGEEAKTTEDPPSEVESLVLEHTTDPVDRAVCQLIKQQLDAIGIPITLRERSLAAESTEDWDLRLVNLGIAEPVVELQPLLGPGGLAGRCTPSMGLALRKLETATNWNDARTRLHDIHQLAADDLPVIPLWQTVNYFAHSKTLQSVGKSPVNLYQNVSQWEQNFESRGR